VAAHILVIIVINTNTAGGNEKKFTALKIPRPCHRFARNSVQRLELKIEWWEGNCWEKCSTGNNSAFGPSFKFGGQQHYENLIAVGRLRLAENL